MADTTVEVTPVELIAPRDNELLADILAAVEPGDEVLFNDHTTPLVATDDSPDHETHPSVELVIAAPSGGKYLLTVVQARSGPTATTSRVYSEDDGWEAQGSINSFRVVSVGNDASHLSTARE